MAGVASRRKCDALIAAGRVAVDGALVTLPGQRVDPERARVTLDGVPVRAESRRLYVLVNKPMGYVVTASDPQGRETIFDLLPELPARVFPVGRLDLNSTGLVLLTNDGEVAERLGHPRYEVERVYRAKVSGAVTEATLERLQAGVQLEDGPARALRARVVKRNPGSTVVEVVVAEGRFHLVRRLMKGVGHPVRRLSRMAMGVLELGPLPLGEARPLKMPEVRALRTSLGLPI
jgi:23S rRNA pseudouridine2605 synthase